MVFNSKSLRPASCAWVRNMLKTLHLSLKSLNLGLSFCLRCPLDIRCPLDNKMSLHLYTTFVKGVVGLGGCGRGGDRVVQAKEDIRYLTNVSRFAQWSSLIAHQLYIHTTDLDRTIVYRYMYVCYRSISHIYYYHDLLVMTLDSFIQARLKTFCGNIHVTKIASTVDYQN